MADIFPVPPRTDDLTNRTFADGQLTVLGCAGRSTRGKILWLCRCRCGKETKVPRSNLMNGHTTSCGCTMAGKIAAARTTHGCSRRGSRTPEYRIWALMLNRCTNPSNPSYPNYGERGIKVCDRWLNSFEAFLADVGQRPTSKHTLERIENNGNYEPDNCRWATRAEQTRNTRRTHFLTSNGETHCLADWAKITGLTRGRIGKRLRLGWSVEAALWTPVDSNRVNFRFRS